MPLPPNLLSHPRGHWLALDGIQHFKRKIIAASCEVADRATNQVVCNHGGDGDNQSARGGDERFRNAGSHCAQCCRAAGAESMKRIDDSPDGAEQSNERRDCARNSKPWNIALKTRHLFRRSNLHGPLYRQRIPQRAGRSHLALKFPVSRLKYANQWARTKLL